jgi:hypothetical protein
MVISALLSCSTVLSLADRGGLFLFTCTSGFHLLIFSLRDLSLYSWVKMACILVFLKYPCQVFCQCNTNLTKWDGECPLYFYSQKESEKMELFLLPVWVYFTLVSSSPSITFIYPFTSECLAGPINEAVWDWSFFVGRLLINDLIS